MKYLLISNSPIQIELSVTDALAVKLHKEVFRLNGFKVMSKDSDDETCNLYLIKSLPLIKKDKCLSRPKKLWMWTENYP